MTRLVTPGGGKRLLFVSGTALVVALFACSSSDEAAPAPLDAPDRAVPEGGSADAITLDGPSCANGTKDGDETDLDCGGATCPPCANERGCAVPRDCVSNACTNGKCSTDVGCSDGTREAFADQAKFPNIAACGGGWAVAGLGATTMAPACGRAAGNSSANPKGMGCNVADLCQTGWHVCGTPAEVGTKAGPTGCAGAVVAGANAFYAVRQSGSGGAMCGAGTNDLFGCGDVGVPPDAATCAPLDRFSNDLCMALPKTWSCGANGADEQNGVTKTDADGGGVLCCRD